MLISWRFIKNKTCLYDPPFPGTKITGAPVNFKLRADSVNRPSEYAYKLYFGNFSFSRKLIF